MQISRIRGFERLKTRHARPDDATRDKHLNSISHASFHPAAAEDGKQPVYHKLQQNVHILYDHRLSFPSTRRSIIGQRFYF